MSNVEYRYCSLWLCVRDPPGRRPSGRPRSARAARAPCGGVPSSPSASCGARERETDLEGEKSWQAGPGEREKEETARSDAGRGLSGGSLPGPGMRTDAARARPQLAPQRRTAGRRLRGSEARQRVRPQPNTPSLSFLLHPSEVATARVGQVRVAAGAGGEGRRRQWARARRDVR